MFKTASKNLNQTGVAHLILILGIIGIALIMLVANLPGLKDKFLNSIYPKDPSYAQQAPTTKTAVPILIVTSEANPFSKYYAEILKAEGFNNFNTIDISQISTQALANYDAVVVGEVPLNSSQVTAFSDWVNKGGNLILMKPDKQMLSLAGLRDLGTTQTEGFILITTSNKYGKGIVGETIQYHGTADKYTLSGATNLARLYSNISASTTSPAVSIRNVGTSGGQVVVFSYDLAKSIIYTRQGNPAWEGQKADPQGTKALATDFFNGSVLKSPQPDWVNTNKIGIPQADEQQRFLANILVQTTLDKKPLPRFWYLPYNHKVAVVMTGDDHNNKTPEGNSVRATEGRFDLEIAKSEPGCILDRWECIRSTSYIMAYDQPPQPIKDTATNYINQGFEISIHPNLGGCPGPADLYPAFHGGKQFSNSFESSLRAQLLGFDTLDKDNKVTGHIKGFNELFPTVPAPVTVRIHCVLWDGWDMPLTIKSKYGFRFDTDYYYYETPWVNGRVGYFTGSAIPMRFTLKNGTLVDMYQGTTQFTDEGGLTYPDAVDQLVNKARGPEGYYGAFVLNMHTNEAQHHGWSVIVDSMKAKKVPVISAKQMLDWLDAKDQSYFENVSWKDNVLSFSTHLKGKSNGMMVMLPWQASGGSLAAVSSDCRPVQVTKQTIKGIDYGMFIAEEGISKAVYSNSTDPQVINRLIGCEGNSANTCAGFGGICVNSVNKSSDGRTCTQSGFLDKGALPDCAGEYAYCFAANSCSGTSSPTPAPGSCASFNGVCVNGLDKTADGKTCARSGFLDKGPTPDCTGAYAYCFAANSCSGSSTPTPTSTPTPIPTPTPAPGSCASFNGVCANNINKTSNGKTCTQSGFLDKGPTPDCTGAYAYCFASSSCN